MTKIYMAGTPSTLKGAISVLMGVAQLIQERDVGQWVGYPERDYIKARPLERKLYVQMFSDQYPPFRPEPGKPWVRAEASVPDPDRAKMDWNLIKRALGGSNGYVWGRFLCTIEYENGRQTVVRAADEKTAEKIARALAALSTLRINTVRTTELKREGKYAPGQPLHVNQAKIYPASFYIMSRKRVLQDEINAVKNKTGFYRQKTLRSIPLWTAQPLRDTNRLINELWS